MKKLCLFFLLIGSYGISFGQLLNASSEEIINSIVTKDQINPDISSDSLGNTAIVWESNENTTLGYGYDIKCTILDSTGSVLLSEFLVNSVNFVNDQRFPKVAISNSGNILVTWMGIGSGGDWDTFVKVFDKSGTVLKAETTLPTSIVGNQKFPDTDVIDENAFVIVWQDEDVIKGKTLETSTFNTSSEFVVDSTEYTQKYPSVSGLDNQKFVIAWQQLNSSKIYNIHGQVFNVSATPQTGVLHLSSDTTEYQLKPSVNRYGNDKIIVSYTDQDDGSGEGIYMSILDSALSTTGNNHLKVNTTTSGYQNNSNLTVSKNGVTVFTWNDFSQDGSFNGVYGRIMDGNNNFEGNEFRLNTTTEHFQSFPSASLQDDEGKLRVVWQTGFKDSTSTQDGNEFGISLRTFDLPDITEPRMVCKDISVYLGADSTITIIADSLDGGIYDANGYTLNISSDFFSLPDTGINQVFLTAEDPSGNSASCSADVNVIFIEPLILSYEGIGGQLCENDTFNFKVNAQGYWAEDNEYTIQLSDALGNFNNPIILGVVTDTSFNSISIPTGIEIGNQYKIRVLSSNRSTIGPEYADFQLSPIPRVNVSGNYLIENGETISIPVEISGESTINFSLAGVEFASTSATTSISLTPSSSGVFTANNVTNQLCYGESTGNIEVTFDISPCLSNVSIGEVNHYGLIKSSDVITSTGTTNNITIYQAGNSITLNPGFKTNTSEPFKAIIKNCPEE